MSNAEERNAYFDRLCNTPGLMWLGQNTNHFDPHPSLRDAIIQAFDEGEYHAYAPPLGFETLRALIGQDVGLPDASVMVTDGAVEALYNVCSHVCEAGKDFVTTNPSWSWPMQFAARHGCKVVELPIYDPAQQYKLTPEQLRDAVNENTGVIYLVDPNNPLGTCHTAAEIREFAAIARSVGAYLIHDITYFHFADHHTPAYRFYPEKTILTYSFSKWLGLAGMRLGAVIANAGLIERFASAPPNNLGSNVLSQRAAIAGLRNKAQWFPEINRRQRRNQAEVLRAAQAVPGLSIPVYPSQANLLVMETVDAGVTPEALVAAYQEHGVMIRQGSYHTKRFGHRFVKISLTVPEKWADRFCELLPAMVERARAIDVPANQY
ncbi:pyridoxal phosphate-dependent aminotransferase [Achromobacter sp. 413638]|uniref:pyridoxal phosphate-dependent aminotransferase n=1 Tax=Achromobacter sp. 413638 TaxID=3342385 RepID=UPI00370C8A63